MLKKTLIVLCAFMALCANGAAKWKNLNDDSHLSGEKITEADMLGKAVLIFYWDAADAKSTAYLASVQKVWSSFMTKKFRVIGNHVGTKDAEKVKAEVTKNKVTFPVYQNASLESDPISHVRTPSFCVVNHRGVVVYSGLSEKESIEHAVNAISAIGMPIGLCEDVTFKKFKGLANQIKLGKNLTSIVKSLDKVSEGKDSEADSEAQEILSAISSAKDDVKADIELYKEADPREAVKLINLFIKTWPEDESAKEYKSSLSELKKAAREFAKAEKEKAKRK